MIEQALKDISSREREATVAWISFQEVVIATTKEEVPISSRLSIPEKARGNILLKAREHNISESIKRAKEMRDSCEETFGLINKNLLDLDKESSVGTLGKINIAKHLLDIRENGEKGTIKLSQVSQVNIDQLDKWLIIPSLQLWYIITKYQQVGK
jgi:hypothetical protein